MNQSYFFSKYFSILRKKCDAWADIVGTDRYVNATGTAIFFDTEFGIAVVILVTDMPKLSAKGENVMLECCIDEEKDGLLPLLYNDSVVFSAFLTNHYIIDELLDKSLEISDNDGNRVAYGTIQKNNKTKK